jgi:hypothetical protein
MNAFKMSVVFCLNSSAADTGAVIPERPELDKSIDGFPSINIGAGLVEWNVVCEFKAGSPDIVCDLGNEDSVLKNLGESPKLSGLGKPGTGVVPVGGSDPEFIARVFCIRLQKTLSQSVQAQGSRI